MSASWMEALHAKHTETAKLEENTRYSNRTQRNSNRGHKRLRSQRIEANSSGNLVPIVSAAAASSPAGFLQSLFDTKDSVRYVALNQTDLEKADHQQQHRQQEDNEVWDSGSEVSEFRISGDSGSSSSVEDLFATRPKRKVRRKMGRRGNYAMRETFENSRQYYPTTHQQHHQHLHQQTIQAQCNRHKGFGSMTDEGVGVAGGGGGARVDMAKSVGQQQQHMLQHQYPQNQQQSTTQIRSEYQQQQQQHQSANQQYQNINSNATWLPQTNKITREEIDGYRQSTLAPSLSIQPQQQAQLQHHGQHYQEPQQQNYCSKHTDNNIAPSAANDIDAMDPSGGGGGSAYVMPKKTYITPFDIPSPPPQPVLNDHKRFSSGQYTKAAATLASNSSSNHAAMPGNNANIKPYCQCEHNVRAPKSGTVAHTNHNHFQQQQTPHQRQAHITASATSNIATSSLPHQQQQQLHNHSHHHVRHYPDETLMLPRASSLKQTNSAQPSSLQHTPHHHQHHHHPPQQHQQYRKIDVFAAVDDDDNDTSPSIKLSHLDYGYNKILPRYGKHLPNKQQTHQHNFVRTGYPQYNNNSSSSTINLHPNLLSNDNPNDADDDDDDELEVEQNENEQQQQHNMNMPHDNGVTVNGFNIASSGSYDTDSGLTEGRHCDLFCEKQGLVYEANQHQHHQQQQQHRQKLRHAYPTKPPALLLQQHAQHTSHQRQHVKQIRINTANRIDDEPLNKALRSTMGIATIAGTSTAATTITAASTTNRIRAAGGNIASLDVVGGSRNSLHHNIYNNDSYESRLANDHNMSSSSTFLLEDNSHDASSSDALTQKTFIVPLDIPTPPPQPQIPHGLQMCQCENIGSSNHFHQVNHHRHSHKPHQQQISTLTPSSPSSLQDNNVETTLANGLSHHHQKNGLNYKLHEQHQQQQQQSQQHHYPAVSFGQHFYGQHHGLGKLQHQQQQQPLQHNHWNRQRNSFHHMGDKNYMKSLVYSPQKLRKFRILLGIVGAIVILALLGTALYFIISGSSETTNGGGGGDSGPSNGIHLEDILQGKLISRTFNGSWSNGESILYKDSNAIMELNVKTNQSTLLMLDEAQQYVLYEKSADNTLLLLAKNYKKNFRHTYEAEYDIFNITSGQIQPLLIQNQERPLILVQWSPVGNALVINFERNLYYKPSAFAAEIALTDDTNAAILNGIPDWVYEEEVFSSNSAVWFSPDGSKLAFIQFDDSPTHIINFPVYGEAGDLRFQYPYNRLVAYPKAGSPNPRVKLFTSDLASATAGNTDHLTEIPRPSALNTESDYIITVVDWLNSSNVLSVWMNRIQNSAHMQIFNGLRRQEIYSLDSKTGWVDFFSAPFKNRDGSRIALILPQAQGNDGEYRHLCLQSTASTRNTPEAITKGKYVVTSILHWDSGSDVIFYTANTENNPEYLHVYAIRAAAGQNAKCLTCGLHKSNGIEQSYYSADFNTANQVIITSLGPSIPMTSFYEWAYANYQVTLRKLRDWENNDNLRNKLKDIALPSIEIKTIKLPSNDFTAKVLLQLPPNFDRSGNTKYPMLVDVYGGPDSYSVVNKWILDWGTYLSSNQSVIYAKIDGRGSGLRGEKLLHSVYKKLGTVEIDDQIQVARILQEQNSFIDAKHTGIWGWSYGGYAAAMALANDNANVFSCAASIAPVTDWAYYDSIYTERYMSLPTLNEIGYQDSRLSTRALKLKGKKFLLVHGTLDDNVHYQQAMILAKNLERNDILFKQISYPDEDHALAGVRPHLYHSLDRFFGECFAQKRMVYRK